MRRPTNASDLSEPDRARILEALSQVLASEKFAVAPQMTAFLRYVVEQAVSGNKRGIKAYSVAVDALGKPESFDPQNDPVVRVLAGRLRASLTTFYETRPDVEVRIVMKPGSYVPQFIDNTPDDNADSTQSVEATADSEFTASEPTTPLPVAPQAVTAERQGRDIQAANADSKRAVLLSQVPVLLRFPTIGLAMLVLAVGAAILLKSVVLDTADTPLSAAVSAKAQTSMTSPERERPLQVSVFVEFNDRNEPLAEQLTTMIGGTFLESSDIRVYRLPDTTTITRFWPEDYIVVVDVLPLPDKTSVKIQLLEAQTGRIGHSGTLNLSKTSHESLTREEFADITQYARRLVSENGPLLTSYRMKKIADKETGSTDTAQDIE